ncbi:signal peptidase I [Natrinema saccharevitans]|uniref:signal peptidase I n=1 Tax=Natrinema saccharevitans TaxID=301967 RepID=UPI00096CE69F|nr:signal peptidase I [Natrinema saccharevitans]
MNDAIREALPERRSLVNVVGVLVLLAIVVPFLIVGVPQLAGASQSHVVLSDSMSPTFESGDVILVEDVDPASIESGDVITYADGSGERTTHRVVEVVERDGERQFRTQGDANDEPDGDLVSASAVEGRHTQTLPHIGHVVLFAGSRLGIALFVIVPGTLLAVSEVWNLYRAWIRAEGDDDTSDADGNGDSAGARAADHGAPEPTEDD